MTTRTGTRLLLLRVRRATLAGAAAIASVAGLAVVSVRGHLEASAWVERTVETQHLIDRTLWSLTEVQDGQRGYLLTGKQEYLASLEQGRAALDVNLAALRRSTSNDPAQVARVDELARLARARVALALQSVRLAEAGDAERALAPLRDGTGKRLTDGGRAIAAAMQAHEKARLQARMADATEARTRAVLALAAALLLAVAVAIAAASAMARDGRALRLAEDELLRSRALYRSMVQSLPDTAVVVFDHELRYLAADGVAVLRTLGLAGDAVVGKRVLDVASPEAQAVADSLYRPALEGRGARIATARDGRSFVINAEPLRNADGEVTAGMLVIRDVTEQKAAEAKLAAQAAELRALSLRDELTGLHNRRGLLVLAEQQVKAAARARRNVALIFVDLDGMKSINDAHGHEMGDRALVETAHVLRETFRGEDVLARLGGDEFVVFVSEATADGLAVMTERLRAKLSLRAESAGLPFRLEASVGVAMVEPSGPEALAELLGQADARMYEAKRSARLRRAS